VLLVAHEETLRVLHAWHQGLPDQALDGLSFGNCELLEFEFDPDNLTRTRL
jgi:broad specificity phosphatase PhoE